MGREAIVRGFVELGPVLSRCLRLPTADRRPAALGRSEPGRLYASPYVGLAPEAPEALFNSDDLDGMFVAIETLTASAGG